MTDALVRVECDVCDIAQRIRAVDEHYFIVYNRVLHRFELHDSSFEDTFACVLPFARLDERSIRHARRTRVERVAKLLEELDAENDEREGMV